MGSPVYIQIHNQIKKDIEAGVWSVGDRIPSERELALEFNVSRMTLRQAVQTLVEEGILERQVGAGTFVARKKVQEKMTGVTSFTELMEDPPRRQLRLLRRRGRQRHPVCRVLHLPRLPPQDRRAVNQNQKEACVHEPHDRFYCPFHRARAHPACVLL